MTQARLTRLRRLCISYPLLDICKQSGGLNKYISFVFINFIMITKQLIDNNIAIKMLSLMRIKKLHCVIFAVVAVYLQRKTA